jgi:hypothetical protein
MIPFELPRVCAVCKRPVRAEDWEETWSFLVRCDRCLGSMVLRAGFGDEHDIVAVKQS